jgi:hypothetical protein
MVMAFGIWHLAFGIWYDKKILSIMATARLNFIDIFFIKLYILI